MTEELLFSQGYKKTDDNRYERVDEETGMTVGLVFNPNGSTEETQRIEDEIIEILARQDI